jgi:prostaglandin-H2 D-isomerase / glutathione transferase
MTKPKLTYFDAPVSRGEECRLALSLAGIDFEDVRLKPAEWAVLKPASPYGAMPTLELPGKPVIGHSNAILVYIGRTSGLHPKDDFEAARHEGMMSHCEDLRTVLALTMRMPDDEKKRKREEYSSSMIPEWCAFAEKNITGPFFAGEKPHVVDAKIHMIVRWLGSGKLDHVPATIVKGFPKLMAAHDAVAEHPAVKAWYARTS